MKKHLYRILAVGLLLVCLGIGARAEGANDFCGIWVAEGVTVEIWIEDGEAQCRAVFLKDGGEAIIWAYSPCWYSQEDHALECPGVTRTRERLDGLWNTLEELDWSINDMCFSGFELSGDGLVFTDELLDGPIILARLSEADARSEALAYLGLWTDGTSEVRAEDHGVCYLFTVTTPVDAVTDHRWTYTCLYDPDTGRMMSVSVSPRRIITHEADGGTVEIEEDDDAGEAAFTLEEGGQLIVSGLTGNRVTFERFVFVNPR